MHRLRGYRVPPPRSRWTSTLVADWFQCHSVTACGPSGLKVAVAADGDVWRRRPRPPALLRLCAAVAGLGAVRGSGQQLLVVVVAFVLVLGAFGGVLRGHNARILLEPGPDQRRNVRVCGTKVDQQGANLSFGEHVAASMSIKK